MGGRLIVRYGAKPKVQCTASGKVSSVVPLSQASLQRRFVSRGRASAKVNCGVSTCTIAGSRFLRWICGYLYKN